MQQDSQCDYSIGYSEGALALMRFRSAERCCQFFRAHIEPTSRILDCGCGPGVITTGLAQWAPQGESVGIDLGDEQLAAARAFARERGARNVRFRQGDVFDLPFADNCFDVVFSQAMLCHIPDRDKAVAEMKRVLRPGGLIALSDVVSGSVVRWPEAALLAEVPRLFRLGMQRSGGDPDHGRKLGELLQRGGFRDVFLSFRFEQPESPQERATYFDSRASLLDSDGLGSLAVREGWIGRPRLDELISRLRGLGAEPGAAIALPMGQAIGRKAA